MTKSRAAVPPGSSPGGSSQGLASGPSPDAASRSAGLPAWESVVAGRLATAERMAPLVGRVTPANLAPELAALAEAFRRARPRSPRFVHEPLPPSPVAGELSRLADELARLGEPLALDYAERARELALERRLCETVGSPAFAGLARARFAASGRVGAEADALARRWLDEGMAAAPDASPTSRSDDEGDPLSLVARMRQAIGARRLSYRVLTSPRLSALAATGDGVILVAEGRRLTRAEVERTVLHEVEGHAAPRARAEVLPLGLFRVATALGSDDQEGRALLLEERAGHLDGERRRELALRHLACRDVEGGADFVTTARRLEARGAPLEVALRIAARAHRGGGLARELVYLPCYLAVKAAVAARPGREAVLAAGRIAVEAADRMAPYLAHRDDALA